MKKTPRTAGLSLALFAHTVLVHGVAFAQGGAPEGGDDTSMAFRAVDGATGEDVNGGALMVAAYGVILVLLLGYVLYLARLQAGTTAELVRLRAAIQKDRGNDKAPAATPEKAASAEGKD